MISFPHPLSVSRSRSVSLPQWKMYNPLFSQVEIWFRFVFVVLTFMVTVRDVCVGLCVHVSPRACEWTSYACVH